jgi:hypothetical protein
MQNAAQSGDKSMKCAYCFEDMNEGARVCRVCRRKQPLPPAEAKRRNAMLAIATFVVLAVSAAGYFIYDSLAEEDEIQRALLCYNGQGGMTNMTEDKVREQLAIANTLSHAGWRANLKLMNSRVGCGGRNSEF